MSITVKQNTIFRISVFGLGIVLSYAIFYINHTITGPEVTFTLMYLVPIIAVTWYSGLWFAIVIALSSITEWAFIQLQNDHYPADMGFSMYLISKLSIFIFIIIVISRLKVRIEKEKSLSDHDHLTGALNRKGFFEILETETYRAKRSETPLTLAYLDVDNFKRVNDTLGHHEGDKVLIKLTEMVQSIVRKTDVLGRLGGDEFILIFPDTDISDSRSIIRKLKSGFGKISASNHWPVSLSIGVGIFKGNHLNVKKNDDNRGCTYV
jgi:diguanylate cyclase (GGDEF)-like protein